MREKHRLTERPGPEVGLTFRLNVFAYTSTEEEYVHRHGRGI